MKNRREFAASIARQSLNQIDTAIAFLWFYKQNQEYDERTAAELASDMHDESLPRPNVTRLDDGLRRSKFTIKGKRAKTFQINLRHLAELDERYTPVLGMKAIPAEGRLLANEDTQNTRLYIERLAHQINVCYETGLYDASAVLCRRLMESLLIEVYVSKNRAHEVQQSGGGFKGLEAIIDFIVADKSIVLGRSSPKTMKDIKAIGDTAAHDRTYITKQIDLDDVKQRYRKLIAELLQLSGIKI